MPRLASVMRFSKRLTFAVVTSIVICTVGSAHAASSGRPGGTWPKSWPKELEPLREQAWTWEHGLVGQISYDIPFANREEFETAWPHILKLKSKGAPLTLVNSQHYHGKAGDIPASVVIFPPLKGSKTGPLSTTRVYLKIDGKIVDLNRIRLPADTPIVDERFKNRQKKLEAGKKPTAEKKPATDRGSAAAAAPAPQHVRVGERLPMTDAEVCQQSTLLGQPAGSLRPAV